MVEVDVEFSENQVLLKLYTRYLKRNANIFFVQIEALWNHECSRQFQSDLLGIGRRDVQDACFRAFILKFSKSKWDMRRVGFYGLHNFYATLQNLV